MKSIFISVLFFLYSINAYALQKHENIPEIFQGLWVSDITNCKTDHFYNLLLTPDSLQFNESAGLADAVVTNKDNELAIITELSGEGYTWIGFVHYKLSLDNSNLTDISDPHSGKQLKRYRCPK